MRRSVLLFIWLLIDLALFLAAYVSAYFFRVGFIISTDFPLDLYVRVMFLVAPLWILILISFRIFTITRVQSSIRNMIHIAYSSLLALALFSLAYYFLYGQFFSRLLLVYAGVSTFVLTALWHLAFDQWQRRILRRSPPAYPLLIIGANRDAERLITLLNTKQSVFTPVAILESRGTSQKDIGGVPVLGKLNKLEDVIKEKKITHMAQCADLEHTLNLLSVCRQHGLTYMLLPSVLGIVEGDERTEMLEGLQPVTMVAKKSVFRF
jgi:FlaA1/EpsC-like NDP-sugar epimerase